MSFESFTYRTKVETDNNHFRPTDSITTLLDIIAKTGLPVTALTINVTGEGLSYAPDPQQLQFQTMTHSLKQNCIPQI